MKNHISEQQATYETRKKLHMHSNPTAVYILVCSQLMPKLSYTLLSGEYRLMTSFSHSCVHGCTCTAQMSRATLVCLWLFNNLLAAALSQNIGNNVIVIIAHSSAVYIMAGSAHTCRFSKLINYS